MLVYQKGMREIGTGLSRLWRSWPGGLAFRLPTSCPGGLGAVKDSGSRIRENSVVSGIALSLTTSATTYTHAFSRVKQSLTAWGYPPMIREFETCQE